MTSTLFIKTYGCQMNVYDSARMAELLAPLGYAPASSAADADMVILNTCHIREKASEKVYSELGRLRAHKERRAAAGRGMIVAVAGCVAQAEGEEILRRAAPVVDIVLGPQTYHRLPEMVARATRAAGGAEPGFGPGRGIVAVDFPPESKFDFLPGERTAGGPSAFLSVQEGCDRFCTFCVVPYTRGAEFSRPLAQVEDEARRLVAAGAREIVLLGQNVNAWHGATADGEAGLGGLVRALARIPGLERIRYTTSHPRDMTADLVAAHGEVPELMPFLHLPVQSGSDRVLAAMNRRHTAGDYRRTVAQLRRARPDLALGSDFIVGFPGETDADFRATLDLVREIGFSQAYSFLYSARPGTPAAALDDPVPRAEKEARLAALQALIAQQQDAFNAATVGREVAVLLERSGRHAGQLVGRSPGNQAVHVTAAAGEAAVGDILAVAVTGVTGHGLAGVPAAAGPARVTA